MRCMCGGTDFPQALKSLTVVPLRGGDRREDLQFELIIPGGVRIALIAAPSDTEVENPTRGRSMCPRHKHCSYVFVDSSQITGGRIRTAITRKPRPPQRFLKDSLGKPKVYLACSFCGVPSESGAMPPC